MATKTMDVVLSDAPLDRLLAAAHPEVARILDGVLCGHEVDRAGALRLAHADGADLQVLVATADALRRQVVGDRVTYVVNRNINFTNVCIVGCTFCGFSRKAGAQDAYDLSMEQVVTKARQAWERGATEVCIQGGLPAQMEIGRAHV